MKFKILSLITVGLVFFASCSQDIALINQESDSSIYASVEELDQISEDSDVYAKWRVSRVLAKIELEDFREDNNWDNATLSERPVIIYSQDFTPKYFEFHVISGGKLVGAISCAAKKEIGSPVQYVMEYVNAYEEVNNRGVSNVKIVDNNYPSSFSYGDENTRSIYNPVNNEQLQPESLETPLALDLLKNADEEELKRLNINSEEEYQLALNNLQNIHDHNDAVWKEIEEYENLILSYTEKEISEFFVDEETRGSYDKIHYVAECYNYRNSISVSGRKWCGPYVLAFLSMSYGFYPDSGKGSNLSTSVYKSFESKTGTGPVYWDTLNSALKSYTSLRLYVKHHHDWKTAANYIRRNKMPLISLRSSSGFNRISWHYRAIIGVRERKIRRKRGFFRYYEKKYNYYMHDNGADGRNFWETGYQLYHFQMAEIKY